MGKQISWKKVLVYFDFQNMEVHPARASEGMIPHTEVVDIDDFLNGKHPEIEISGQEGVDTMVQSHQKKRLTFSDSHQLVIMAHFGQELAFYRMPVPGLPPGIDEFMKKRLE